MRYNFGGSRLIRRGRIRRGPIRRRRFRRGLIRQTAHSATELMIGGRIRRDNNTVKSSVGCIYSGIYLQKYEEKISLSSSH
jgi:hypothetical protein